MTRAKAGKNKTLKKSAVKRKELPVVALKMKATSPEVSLKLRKELTESENKNDSQSGPSTNYTKDSASPGDRTSSSESGPIDLFTEMKSNKNIISILAKLTGKKIMTKSYKESKTDYSGHGNIFESSSNLEGFISTIINLICRSCGSLIEIQPWQVHENVDSTLEEVFSRIDENTNDAYILGGTDSLYRHFRRNYSAFWKALIGTLDGKEVNSMQETLSPWLFAMTESKSRAFRHSSSIAAFGILYGLIERISQNARAFDDKPAQRKAIQQEIDTFSALTVNMYTNTFVRRARDVHQPIRILAIDALQSWVCIYPKEYLKPEYTKNFGFLLHDKSPEVRRSALDAISTLYSTENEEHDGLQKFTDRFRDRIIDLTRDVDSGCIASALNLCKRIMQYDYHHNHLHSIEENYPREKMDMVLRTVFDERVTIRKRAGALLDASIKLTCVEQENENARTMKRVEALLQFITEARDRRRVPGAAWYAVDSLLPESSESHNRMKRSRKRSKTEQLSNILVLHYKDIRNIVTSDGVSLSLARSASEIMSALVAHAASNPNSAFEELNSDSLIEFLLKSLDIHQNVKEIVSALCGILPHIKCENISIHSSTLVPLLHYLGTLFARAEDQMVLDNITLFYEAILPLTSATQQSIRDSFQDLVKQATISALDKSDIASWKRVHALYRVTNLGEINRKCIEQLDGLLPLHSESGQQEDTSTKVVIIAGCISRACFWFVSMHKNEPSYQIVMKTFVEDSREILFRSLHGLLNISPSNASKVFMSLCDLCAIHEVPLNHTQCDSLPSVYCSLVRDITKKQVEINTHKQNELRKKTGESNMIEHVSRVYAEYNAGMRKIESGVGNLNIGIMRLIKLGAFSIDGVAEILGMWPTMPSKRLSDSLKDIFHLIKQDLQQPTKSTLFSVFKANEDHISNVIKFELLIIHKSFTILKENDFAQSSLQHFQNLCSRLAQTHFMPQSEANRLAVNEIFKSLIQSVSENPVANAALLCSILPYATRMPSENLKELTNEFIISKLNEVPEFFRLLFVNAIQKKIHIEPKLTQESIRSPDDDLGQTQLDPSSQTLFATPEIQSNKKKSRNSEMSLNDLSLDQSSKLLDRDIFTNSMETFLSTAQSPPRSALMSSQSQQLVDTVARPSGNAEKSSLIVGEEASEYLLESQIFYD